MNNELGLSVWSDYQVDDQDLSMPNTPIDISESEDSDQDIDLDGQEQEHHDVEMNQPPQEEMIDVDNMTYEV